MRCPLCKCLAVGALALLAPAIASADFMASYTPTALPSSPFGTVDVDVVHPGLTGTSFSASGGTFSMGPTSTEGYDFLAFEGGATLDSSQTVIVSATVALLSNVVANDPNDRSGLGIALTDNQNQYTEAYIDSTGVFINGPGRTRDGSEYAIANTAALHTYSLELSGGVVTLSVDGTPALTSTIFTPTGSLPTLANWATVGDITSDASSTFQLTNFSVQVLSPEPGSFALITLIAPVLMRRSRHPARV